MRFRVPYAFTLAAALAALSSCAHNTDVPNTDLVVFRQVRTFGYEPLDDFGMSGVMRGRLTITRVLRGRPPSPVLTIKYIAHTDLAPDEDFRFHLRRAEDGIYIACRGGPG